jgi:hypothetical protein
MPRTKTPRTEIIRVPEQGLSIDAETLDRLIQRRVAEALADKEQSLLEPWFNSRKVTEEILRLQGVFHRRKFALYYEKWGCIICRKKRTRHGSLGMCQTCHIRIVQRMRRIEQDYAKAHPDEFEQQIKQMTLKVRSAEELLR